MAVITNTCSGAWGNKFNLNLYYTLNSQNLENKTSNITLTLKEQSNDSNYSYWGYSQTAIIKIDGTTKTTNVSSPDLRNQAERTLATWTGDVTHGSDGKLTITILGSFTGTFTNVPSGSVSTSWVLTDIPVGTLDVNVDGTWKTGTVYVNVDGTWKQATGIYTNVDGTWKQSI